VYVEQGQCFSAHRRRISELPTSGLRVDRRAGRPRSDTHQPNSDHGQCPSAAGHAGRTHQRYPSGLTVTELGFGAASLGNLYRIVSDSDARETIGAAIEAGITYFDTAPYYGFGLSERRVGDALREHSGTVLSTKVGRLSCSGTTACDGTDPGIWDWRQRDCDLS
jgi:Aldo/keto reductase family